MGIPSTQTIEAVESLLDAAHQLDNDFFANAAAARLPGWWRASRRRFASGRRQVREDLEKMAREDPTGECFSRWVEAALPLLQGRPEQARLRALIAAPGQAPGEATSGPQAGWLSDGEARELLAAAGREARELEAVKALGRDPSGREFSRWFERAWEALPGAQRATLEKVRARLLDRGRQVESEALAELPEKIVLNDDTLLVDFLSEGAAAARSVGRIEVPVYEGERPASAHVHGTVWLLDAWHVVTAMHVLHARALGGKASPDELDRQIKNARVQFAYAGEQAQGPSVIVDGLVASDDALDYAVLRLKQEQGASPLVVSEQTISLPKSPQSFAVNIIPHPRGGPKRVALRNNAVLAVTDKDLLYFSDTEEGSSGAPVLDDRWRVVAVHRAVTYRDNVQYLGHTVGYANAGTRITAIWADLRAKKFPLPGGG